MSNRNLIIIFGGALIIILAVFLMNTSAPQFLSRQPVMREPVTQTAPSEMNISLSAQNNYNESGIANLKEMSGRVIVTLSLVGYMPNVAQPAHIHMGVCPGVGAVRYPLNSAVNGKSITVLDVTLAQLKQQLPLAINVHKSTADVSTYTSCGMLTAGY